jgi:hypothetical protein
MDNYNIDSKDSISSKNQILVQMLQYQKKNLPYKFRLDIEDLKRIVENIEISPFDENSCCIWKGYITNNDKCKYINFYFKHRKIALHRLLYINYVCNLDDRHYLKFTCPNKGICCNIKHIEKCNLTTTKEQINGKIVVNKTPALQVIKMSTNNEKSKLIVVFD